jgi:hypothetical protein
MNTVPDNYAAFETFENEQARQERLYRRRTIEEDELTNMPFSEEYEE